MLNDKIKGILIGTLIGATLAGGAAIAANGTTLYDVIANGVKIVIDGKKLNPTDANGNAVEPFIYNGTTYLPVRAVANALGKAVYWDGPEYTVYLGDMDGKLKYPTVYLKDMTNIASGGDDKMTFENTMPSNFDENYSNITYFYTNSENLSESEADGSEFLLNMKYEKFKGTFFIPQGSDFGGTVYFKMVADDKVIYTSPKLDKTSKSVDYDVNVKGYNHIKIVPYTTSSVYSNNHAYHVYLANAGFYQ